MRWLFLSMLVVNVVYLGWEMDRETQLYIQNRTNHTVIPDNVGILKLFSELPERPPLQGSIFSPKARSYVAVDDFPHNGGEGSSDNFYTEMPEPVQVDNHSLLSGLTGEIRTIEDTESATRICLSYGPFNENFDLKPLQNWFKEHKQKFKRRVEYGGEKLFWVYIAPFPDQDQAVVMLSDLENQGIEDYRLIQTGKFKNAVSLGLFSSRSGVDRRLSDLNSRGYYPIVMPYYDSATVRVYWLDVVMPVGEPATSETLTRFSTRYNFLPRDCSQIVIDEINS